MLKKVEHEKIRIRIGMTTYPGSVSRKGYKPSGRGTGKHRHSRFCSAITLQSWFVLRGDKKNGAARRSEVRHAAPATPKPTARCSDSRYATTKST
jgi:hypothetical protein